MDDLNNTISQIDLDDHIKNVLPNNSSLHNLLQYIRDNIQGTLHDRPQIKSQHTSKDKNHTKYLFQPQWDEVRNQ